MSTVTRQQLAKNMMKRDKGLTYAGALRLIDGMFSDIKEELKKGNDVSLLKIGRFSVTEKDAHIGRNPKTGEIIDVPAKKQVKFTIAKSLKNLED